MSFAVFGIDDKQRLNNSLCFVATLFTLLKILQKELLAVIAPEKIIEIFMHK